MKRFLWIWLLLLACVSLNAQISSNTARHIIASTSLPATCSPNTGDVYVLVAAGPTGTPYYCDTPNHWTVWTGGGSGGGGGGGGTTPGYPANQPVSGCGVEYVSGLTFNVGACMYTIGGVQYSSPVTSITLSAADPSNPRIDVIYVDNTGAANKLTGTPAASPAQPTVDYSTQLPLNLVLVAANGTTPSGITITTLYDENTEWTSACSANLNCASPNNPFRGTKDIEATNAVLGNNFTLVKPASGTTDLSTQNTLIFYIRSKGTWPSANNTGGNGLRTLSLFWLNGSTQVGVQVVIKDGSFGFSSSNTTSYQQIAIPVFNFGTGSNLVTTLKAQVTGNGGTSSFGWYIDAVTLQSGQTPITLPTNVTQTIASGAKALATGAISSPGCTSAQTATATGTLTTDTIIVSFNGDPTGVTGYIPSTSGILTIIPYPTADTVNFKVCNNTSSSITPGAITLNWRVVR